MKTILILVVIQLGIFAWLQYRNNCPEAVADEASVFEGHSVKIQALRNDTDEDKDEITIQNVSKPLKGKVTRENNLITYSIEKGFVGVDSFTYTVTDGDKVSDEAFIKVQVKENQKPVASNDNIRFYRKKETLLNVIGNDKDNENDSIFIKDFSKPKFGKITKQGNKLVYTTTDNSIQKDSFIYTISDGFSISEKATVLIEIKEKSDPLYPWILNDIGSPAIEGNLARKGGRFVVSASGSDIWGNSDNFGYAWQIASGDCEITTKIESIDKTNEWSKAGVMIRETLDASSKNALVAITGEHGLSFQRRVNTGAGCNGSGHEGIAAPYWVKLTRKDNVFTSYISPDGRKWTETGKESIDMLADVYIGLAVTSHDDSKIGNVSFSSVSVSK